MTLTEKINQWAISRGLDKTDSSKQLIKLQEEVGELSQAHLKDYPDKLRDSIGDIQVVLIIYCLQNGIDYKQCLTDAYNVIANREGRTVGGTFIKEGD
jgi:NTP pyrophosphatase (non-canonical NTP hydrolase)